MSLLEMLTQQLDDRAVGQISGQLGVDQGSAQKAIAAALPMMMSALAKNSSSGGGASALSAALDRDHDGSILDDVAGFLGGGGNQGAGAGILKHMLGSRQNSAAGAVGQASGLDSGSAAKLMAMLAPLVMGALGRQQRTSRLDSTGLASALGQERQKISAQSSIFESLLDQDGDGSVADDLAGIGAKVLGGLFSGRR